MCLCVISHVGVLDPVGRTQEVCRAMVLCATADLPGKAKLLNFTQFSGEFGCCVCTQPGDVVPVGRGSMSVYKHLPVPAPLRKHQECFTNGRTALTTHRVQISCFMLQLYVCVT